MKRIFLLLFISTSFISFSIAQKRAQSVYVELGGPGLVSANYDVRLQKKEDGLGFRVGIGGFSLRNEYTDPYGYGTSSTRTSILLVPVAMNYLIGKDQRHYFEIGAGFTFVNIRDKNDFYDDDEFNSSFGHLHFGYRSQPLNGGFTFRAGITPIFNKYGFIPYYASLSFGYKF